MTDKKADSVKGIDVSYVAHLARLQLTQAEIDEFQTQLDETVEYVKKISELDVAKIEATAHAVSVQNVFRKDEVVPGLDRETVLANSPAHVRDQFLVPKIVE